MEVFELVRPEAHCPECEALPSYLYGYWPLLKVYPDWPDPVSVLVDECWGCGYHRAAYLSLRGAHELCKDR